MSNNSATLLVAQLPPTWRLALTYAPPFARTPTVALLALDVRLADIVRRSHEPMLAQLRLAWWREQLGSSAPGRPEGEPLLAALRDWGEASAGLVALVDGWEAMTGAPPLPVERLEQLAAGRGAAFAALAAVVGAQADADEAAQAGREWALADMARKVSDANERAALGQLVEEQAWGTPRLSRAMRPLAILHGLARRERGRDTGGASGLLAAMRIGLLGR